MIDTAKVIPFAIGGGVILAAVELMRRGNSGGGSVTYATDNSAVKAANDLQLAQIQAGLHNADLASAQAAIQLQMENQLAIKQAETAAQIQIAAYNAEVQKATAFAAESAAKNHNVFGFLTAFSNIAGKVAGDYAP